MRLLEVAFVLLGTVFIIGTCAHTGNSQKEFTLQLEKEKVCQDFIYESCTAMVGCGYASTREACIMAIRTTSICEDPQSIDLERYKKKLTQIKEATCEDISLQPAPLSQKGDAGLNL